MNAFNPKYVSNIVSVTEVQQISKRIRRIRMAGTSLCGISWSPGQKVKLKIGAHLKSYTPAQVDSKAGWMDILFHLHCNGVASLWAKDVSIGDQTSFIGPIDSLSVGILDSEWYMFLGDETTLGLATALTNRIDQHVPILGGIELESHDLSAVAVLRLPFEAIERGDEFGASLEEWVSSIKLPPGSGKVWISGEVAMTRQLRNVLLQRGMTRQQLQIKPYWSLRGHAHRKVVQAVL